MNKNPKCDQDDDCPTSEGYMLVVGIGESIAVREAVLRLQTRLLEIYSPGTEVKTNIKDRLPCRRAPRIAA